MSTRAYKPPPVPHRSPRITSIFDLSPEALGELKAWLEPWFVASARMLNPPSGVLRVGGRQPRQFVSSWSDRLPWSGAQSSAETWTIPPDRDGQTINVLLTSVVARTPDNPVAKRTFTVQRNGATLASPSLNPASHEEKIDISVVASSGDTLDLAPLVSGTEYFEVVVYGTTFEGGGIIIF